MFLHSVSTGCNSFILDMMQESEEHFIKGGLHLLMMGERTNCVCGLCMHDSARNNCSYAELVGSAGAAAGKHAVSQWRSVVGALLDSRCSEHSNSLELRSNCADEP